MDISQTGQRLLTYLYHSIFVEVEKWNFIDPTINGIDCGRWAAEKGIDAQDLITTLDDLEAEGLVRVLFYNSIDAGLTAQGIEAVEDSGLADPDVIAAQHAVRSKMLETLAEQSHGKMRTADLAEKAGITRIALDNNAWYLEKIGSIKRSETRLEITDKGSAEARRNQQ